MRYLKLLLFTFLNISAVAQEPIYQKIEKSKKRNTPPVLKEEKQQLYVETINVNAPKIKYLGNIKMCWDMSPAINALPAKVYPTPPTQYVINTNGLVQTKPATIKQGLAAFDNLKWISGETISVAFVETEGSSIVRNKVIQYAKEWGNFANIKFNFISNIKDAMIKVGFMPNNQSWSWLGRQVMGNTSDTARTMNFGWLTNTTTETEFKRVICHEFGHVLGFIHEHQAPSSSISWDVDVLYPYMLATQGWNKAQVDDNVVLKYTSKQVTNSTYDPSSIMHYSIDPALTTNGFSVAFNTDLSAIDKSFAKEIYPFNEKPLKPTIVGNLLTHDDCDEIEFTINSSGASNSKVAISIRPFLNTVKKVTWWKSIKVPVLYGGTNTSTGQYIELEMQDGFSKSVEFNLAQLDLNRKILFSKAKLFGVHTQITNNNFDGWDILKAVEGGTSISLIWMKDVCN